MWDRAQADWWWLDTFGLPPQVVDEIPLSSYTRIPEIHDLAKKIRREEQERANRG